MQYLRYNITTRYTESSLQQNHGRMRQIVECQFNYVAAVAYCMQPVLVGGTPCNPPLHRNFLFAMVYSILLWWAMGGTPCSE